MFEQYKKCTLYTFLGLGIPNLGEFNVTIPDWKTKELRRAYYSAISFSDYQLGLVLNKLKELDLEEDTIVVFWGDHGWHLGDHAEWCKLTLFETGNRVPFMIRIPGVTDEGMKTSKIVELIDIFPTLVEVAGFPSLDKCPESRFISFQNDHSTYLFINSLNSFWKNSRLPIFI